MKRSIVGEVAFVFLLPIAMLALVLLASCGFDSATDYPPQLWGASTSASPAPTPMPDPAVPERLSTSSRGQCIVGDGGTLGQVEPASLEVTEASPSSVRVGANGYTLFWSEAF